MKGEGQHLMVNFKANKNPIQQQGLISYICVYILYIHTHIYTHTHTLCIVGVLLLSDKQENVIPHFLQTSSNFPNYSKQIFIFP